jgi:pimeloyl-ACP methyl ester carboxylesterase
MAEMPETQFTRTGGVDIAYQVVGSPGQLDLLFIPGWVSHLEMTWELPEFARFLDCLAAMGRLILFDKRDTGFRTGWRGCRRWSNGPTTSRR